jgi:hypothetical protein
MEVGVGPGDAYAEGYSLTPITESIPGLVVTMSLVTNVEATVSRTRPTEERLLLVYFTPSKYTICFED